MLEELKELSKRHRITSTHLEAILTFGFLKRAEFDLPRAIEKFELAKTLVKIFVIIDWLRTHTEISYLKEQSSVLQQLMTKSPESFVQM